MDQPIRNMKDLEKVLEGCRIPTPHSQETTATAETIPLQGPRFPPLEIQPFLRSDRKWACRVMGFISYLVYSGRNHSQRERVDHQTIYVTNGYAKKRDAIGEAIGWITGEWLEENEDRGYILLEEPLEIVKNRDADRIYNLGCPVEPYTVPVLKNPMNPTRRTNGKFDY